jgi:hypothetical protein
MKKIFISLKVIITLVFIIAVLKTFIPTEYFSQGTSFLQDNTYVFRKDYKSLCEKYEGYWNKTEKICSGWKDGEKCKKLGGKSGVDTGCGDRKFYNFNIINEVNACTLVLIPLCKF